MDWCVIRFLAGRLLVVRSCPFVRSLFIAGVGWWVIGLDWTGLDGSGLWPGEKNTVVLKIRGNITILFLSFEALFLLIVLVHCA